MTLFEKRESIKYLYFSQKGEGRWHVCNTLKAEAYYSQSRGGNINLITAIIIIPLAQGKRFLYHSSYFVLKL